MKLQLVSAVLSTLALVSASTFPVNSVWDLRTSVVGTADGDQGQLAMVCPTGGAWDCMVAALENVFVSAGDAMNKGERGGSQQATSKRDVNDLVSFAEKPTEFNGKVFTKFPDNVWRADVGHDHLNETVMERVSELGTTYVRKENDTVYLSSSHPHEKNNNAKRDSNGNFDNPQLFTDVILTWRANAPEVNGISQPDANQMANDIVHEGGIVPKTLCATLVDKNNGGGSIADFGITFNSDQWSFTRSEKPCVGAP
jgi:hypothetical protein